MLSKMEVNWMVLTLKRDFLDMGDAPATLEFEYDDPPEGDYVKYTISRKLMDAEVPGSWIYTFQVEANAPMESTFQVGGEFRIAYWISQEAISITVDGIESGVETLNALGYMMPLSYVLEDREN